jgi:hypothetical protein
MRALRVILLACFICVLAGNAFAKNDKDKGGKGKDGGTYPAPELNFNGPLEYGLLAIAGGSVVLLELRRRRRLVVDR